MKETQKDKHEDGKILSRILLLLNNKIQICSKAGYNKYVFNQCEHRNCAQRFVR